LEFFKFQTARKFSRIFYGCSFFAFRLGLGFLESQGFFDDNVRLSAITSQVAPKAIQ